MKAYRDKRYNGIAFSIEGDAMPSSVSEVFVNGCTARETSYGSLINCARHAKRAYEKSEDWYYAYDGSRLLVAGGGMYEDVDITFLCL